MIQVACDITLYPGRWKRRRPASWPKTIQAALEAAFADRGRMLDVVFQSGTSGDGRSILVQVEAEWWGDGEEWCDEDGGGGRTTRTIRRRIVQMKSVVGFWIA